MQNSLRKRTKMCATFEYNTSGLELPFKKKEKKESVARERMKERPFLMTGTISETFNFDKRCLPFNSRLSNKKKKRERIFSGFS